MPRIKEFDEQEALTKAMDLFWNKGYHSTSMDDLVVVTGVSRSSLYCTYGNKKSLFLQSLDHYRNTVMKDMLSDLMSENAGLKAILDHFEIIRGIVSSGGALNGCLICNTYVELGPHDKEVSEKISECTDKKREIYKNALKNAQNTGQISKNINISAMADHLSNVIMGIAVLCKSSSAPSMINNVIDMALAPLK